MANKKTRDTRPARAAYWASGRLKQRKVRNLMRYCRMTREAAEKFWQEVRGNRRMRTTARK